MGTDHGPGILRETLHGPGGVAMHEVHPDAHRDKASRDPAKRPAQISPERAGSAQGQNDKRMVELGKVSRRKQYQSWLPNNSS
jgi:hypothetical protein